MANIKTNRLSKKGKSYQLLTASLLLCVYLVGTSELTSLHALLHESREQATLHSEINEANSCHRSLFHHAKEKGCDHQAHILAIRKCPLCQLSIQTFHLSGEKSLIAVISYSELQPNLEANLFQGEVHSFLPSRAPPLV